MGDVERRSRTLRNLLDPLAAVVFFADEAHAAFEGLGFRANPDSVAGVRVLDRSAYLMARSACLGAATPAVVAAALAVFKPQLVVEVVGRWRHRVSTADLQRARTDAAMGALDRLLGPPTAEMERAVELLQRLVAALRPEGRLLFAGLQSLPRSDGPLFDLWHAADLFREHRGDSHVAAWSSRGLSAPQACILNDLAQGLSLKSYVRTRGWDDTDLDDAVASLRHQGVLGVDGLTERGSSLRDDIERATDRQQAAAVATIESELDQLCAILAPYRQRIVDAGSYPGRTFVAQVTRWR